MAKSFGARLGARLRGRRETADMSQAQLAERVGVSTNYISVLERGQKLPTLDTLLKLAKAVGVPPGELLGEIRVDDDWLDEILDVARRVPRPQRQLALAILRVFTAPKSGAR